jgi:hypothetical protein
MNPRMQTLALIVDDLQRATAFYEALGFPRRKAGGVLIQFDLGDNDLALVSRDGLASMGLGEMARRPDGQRALLVHHARSRTEVDTIMSQAQAAGAGSVRAPSSGAWGGYSGAFADPDGNVWVVAFNTDLYRA